MKLIKQPIKDNPRERAVTNMQAELHRLRTATDQLRGVGTIEDLDAAERVLWGALLVIDGLLTRRHT